MRFEELKVAECFRLMPDGSIWLKIQKSGVGPFFNCVQLETGDVTLVRPETFIYEVSAAVIRTNLNRSVEFKDIKIGEVFSTVSMKIKTPESSDRNSVNLLSGTCYSLYNTDKVNKLSSYLQVE